MPVVSSAILTQYPAAASTSSRPLALTVSPLPGQNSLRGPHTHRPCSPLPEPKPDEALVRPSRVSSRSVYDANAATRDSPPTTILALFFPLPTYSFQNYTDYFKCIAAKGEDYAPCKQFKRAYNSLCPSACSLPPSSGVLPLTQTSPIFLSSLFHLPHALI